MPVIYALSQAVYAFLLKNVLSKLEAATDKGAIVVTPVDGSENVTVTSNESIKASTAHEIENANIEAELPIEITSNTEGPKG